MKCTRRKEEGDRAREGMDINNQQARQKHSNGVVARNKAQPTQARVEEEIYCAKQRASQRDDPAAAVIICLTSMSSIDGSSPEGGVVFSFNR